MVLENVTVDHELKFTFEPGKKLEGFLHFMNYGKNDILVKLISTSRKYQVEGGERRLLAPYTVTDVRVFCAAENRKPSSQKLFAREEIHLEFYSSRESRTISSEQTEADLLPLSKLKIPIVFNDPAPLSASPPPALPGESSPPSAPGSSLTPTTSFGTMETGVEGLRHALAQQGAALLLRENLISKMAKFLNNQEQQRIEYMQKIEMLEKDLRDHKELNSSLNEQLIDLKVLKAAGVGRFAPSLSGSSGRANVSGEEGWNEDIETHLKAARSERDEAKEKARRMEKELEKLQEEIHALQSDYETVKAREAESLSSQELKFERILQAMAADKIGLQQDISSLKDRLVRVQREKDLALKEVNIVKREAMEEKRRLTAEKLQLQNQWSRRQREDEDFRTNRFSTTAQAASARLEKETAIREKEAAIQEKEAVVREKQTLEEIVEELKAALLAKEKERSLARGAVGEANGAGSRTWEEENRMLQMEVEEYKRKLAGQYEEVEAMRMKLEAATVNTELSGEGLKEKEDEISRLVERLNRQSNEFMQKLMELKKENQQLKAKSEAESPADGSSNIETRPNNLMDENVRLKDEIKWLIAEKEQLEDLLKEAEKKAEEAENVYEQTLAENERMKEQSHNLIQRNKRIVIRLEKRIEELETKSTIPEGALSAEEVQKLYVQLDDITQERENLIAQLEYEREGSIPQEQAHAMRKSIIELENERTRLLPALRREQELTGMLRNQVAELERLRPQLEETARLLEEQRQKYEADLQSRESLRAVERESDRATIARIIAEKEDALQQRDNMREQVDAGEQLATAIQRVETTYRKLPGRVLKLRKKPSYHCRACTRVERVIAWKCIETGEYICPACLLQ